MDSTLVWSGTFLSGCRTGRGIDHLLMGHTRRNQDDIFILYCTFCRRRSTGNMDNDRIQRLRRREDKEMNTLMNVLGGMAAVADAVAPIALICILL